MKYNSRKSTQDHRKSVRKLLFKFAWLLIMRAFTHDRSKLSKEEKPGFDVYTTILKSLTYGSDEYKRCLVELGETLKIHYSRNSHHPEHYPDGMKGMDLVDIVEMFCDWIAASQRHNDGNIYVSILKNSERFNFGGGLASVFENTANRIFKMHQKLDPSVSNLS